MAWAKNLLPVCAAVALAAIGAGSLGAVAASAATCEAKETTELEACVKKADANTEANTIVLAAGQYTPAKTLKLTNASGLQKLEQKAGSGEVTIEGSNLPSENPELFVVEEGVSAAFKNFVIAHAGKAASAAVEVVGSIELEGVTLGGNLGPALLVQPQGTASLLNSTLSDNTSDGLINGDITTTKNVSIAFNKLGGTENSGTLNATNTLVAENPGGDCAGLPFETNDHNLDSDGSCAAEKSSGKGKAGLSTTAFNDGGPTILHPLKPGSPAIDAGDMAACPPTDQSGHPRPDVPTTACDIGADEYNETPPIINVPEKIVEESEGPVKVAYTASAESSDDAVRKFECTPPSGSEFDPGKTTVTCKAIDGHESHAEKSFEVEVISPSTTTTTTTTEPPTTTTTEPPTTTTTEPPTTTTTEPPTTTTTEPPTTTTTEPPTTTTTEPPTTTTTEPPTTTTTEPPTTTNDRTADDHRRPNRRRPRRPNRRPRPPRRWRRRPRRRWKTTPTITTSASTTSTTSTGRPPAESPSEVLRQLIHEVKLAKLPRHLRHELLALLEEALHSLQGSGFGASASAPKLAFQQDWRLIRAPFATLSTKLDTVAVASKHTPPAKACGALSELIDLVQADQRSHKSKIPGALARELIQSARSIGAQVGCGSLSHGHSSKHPHGRSTRQQRHR